TSAITGLQNIQTPATSYTFLWDAERPTTTVLFPSLSISSHTRLNAYEWNINHSTKIFGWVEDNPVIDGNPRSGVNPAADAVEMAIVQLNDKFSGDDPSGGADYV